MANTQNELILDSSRGFIALLNNDLELANEVFSSRPASPFHGLGLGLTEFLKAALGQEDDLLYGALSILVQAETLATAQLAVKRSKDEPVPAFEAGLEYKLLISVSVLCQALVHVLTESYLEFVKAVYKLNRAYKGFAAAFKIVFPLGVEADSSIASIVRNLNATFLARTSAEANGVLTPSPSSVSLNSTASAFVGSVFGWGKKRSVSNASLKQNASSSTLPTLSSLSLKVPVDNTSSRDVSPSLPSSRPPSVLEFGSSREKKVAPLVEEVPAALWIEDPLSSLVISGAAFGFGLFGLIFSLLPPKLKKIIAWFGFGNSNRAIALKLLTVAALTGNDVHGFFASLALVTYYCVILLMSGWQNDEQYLVTQCEAVLSKVEARFPDGTLWVLNRAKICRMKYDIASAIKIIETALEKGSKFRQADSLLVFELSWCYLSDASFVKAADSFLRMRTLNSWSHSTYVFIAAGALLDLPLSERTPEIIARIDGLFAELPALIGKKRLMGEAPATEMFISRRIAAYKAKHTRWIAEGRCKSGSKYWEVIKISPASELAHFWNTTGRAPKSSLKIQIDHLSNFSPPPKFGPYSTSSSSTAPDDLDPEELCVRNLLLGSLYRSQGDLPLAEKFLVACVEAESSVGEEKWACAFARYELAICSCQQGDIDSKGPEGKSAWEGHLGAAEQLLATVFALAGDYNLRSRLESRAQMLRDEIEAKRAAIAT